MKCNRLELAWRKEGLEGLHTMVSIGLGKGMALGAAFERYLSWILVLTCTRQEACNAHAIFATTERVES